MKLVIAVSFYDRVADLEDGVGESVELAKIVGEGADSAEQAANGRKERAGRAGDSELHRQILAGCVGKALADREVTETGAKIIDEAGVNGAGPADDAILEWIAKIGDAVAGQQISFSGRVADRLLRITAKNAVVSVGGPINLEVALIGIVYDALLIKQGVAGGRCRVERRIHDVGRGITEGQSGGGEVVERNGNSRGGANTSAGSVQLGVSGGQAATNTRPIESGRAQFSEVTSALRLAEHDHALG